MVLSGKEHKVYSIGCFEVVNVVFPLLAGGFIYLYFYQNVVFARVIGGIIGDINIQQNVPLSISEKVIRNYFADAFWSYALAMSVSYIYGYEIRYVRRVLLISIGFSVICELLQLFRVFEGTFDVLDIVTEIAAIIVAVLIIKRYKRRI